MILFILKKEKTELKWHALLQNSRISPSWKGIHGKTLTTTLKTHIQIERDCSPKLIQEEKEQYAEGHILWIHLGSGGWKIMIGKPHTPNLSVSSKDKSKFWRYFTTKNAFYLLNVNCLKSSPYSSCQKAVLNFQSMFLCEWYSFSFWKDISTNLGFPSWGKDAMLLHNLLCFLPPHIQFKTQLPGDTQDKDCKSLFTQRGKFNIHFTCNFGIYSMFSNH